MSQATCHVYIDGDGCGIECLPVGGHDLEEAGGAKAEAGGPELRNCTVHHPAPRFAPVEVLWRDGEGDHAPRYTAVWEISDILNHRLKVFNQLGFL